MVKIEFDNVAAQEGNVSPGYCIGWILRQLVDVVDAKMCQSPYEYPVTFKGREVGTMTVDDNPPE